MNKKNDLIADIILRENYMPTELDLFIILNHYNIPSIVVGLNKGFVMSPGQFFINFGNNEKEKYLIVTKVTKLTKAPKKNLTSSISFGLIKFNNNEKIKPERLNKKIIENPLHKTSLDTFINLFITSRLKLQNKTKESKKKKSVKKLGKKRL
tara:strand:- start:131 stop:586 length:456 start_codon:yes stop_codon:yes gene_type:complete